MATVDRPRNNNETFTSEAIDLLDTYSCGFDDLLSQIASDLAAIRCDPGKVVEVEQSDIRQAAKIIFDAVKASDAPQSVKADVDRMMNLLTQQSDCA